MKYQLHHQPSSLAESVLAIVSQQPATRQQLCHELHVSRSSLGRALQELLVDGPVVRTRRTDASRPGRPTELIEFDPLVAYRVGINISRSTSTAVMINRRYDIVVEVSAAASIRRFQSVAEPLSLICAQLDDAAQAAGIHQASVSQVGIGIPMPLAATSESREEHALLEAVIGEHWQARVLIDNTVRFGAISEALKGAGKGHSTQLYVRIGAGVGSTLVFADQFTGGISQTAGELGHVQVDPQGEPCFCGGSGCLESLVSSAALCQARGVADLDSLKDLYEDGDATVVSLLDRTANYIAAALKTVIIVASPQVVVFSGDVVETFPVLSDLVAQELHRMIPQRFSAGLQVTCAYLGKYGPAMGAALATNFLGGSRDVDAPQ
ncbi:ROK family protein [Corynebacterium uterequi]|uniref:Transcriptional regulator/sugar kinase n=1 Tax=Corynebacterium uterequi TaxID=1072256 RepID=A0A0G3HEU1_9CORY|nr:ROK family protein [Corynebacterium uterequi]AKK11824.1 transcriptional regulator/sugar kinase [Corynebacterium uterequi]